MPKGDAARYLCTSPDGLAEMGVRPKLHPVRKIEVYDRRDLDAAADAIPYVGDDQGEQPCQADEVFG
jgi:hypothetical protein